MPEDKLGKKLSLFFGCAIVAHEAMSALSKTGISRKAVNRFKKQFILMNLL